MRCWTFAGSESDQRIIRTVKDDLGAWNLYRLVWVVDAGFASSANRVYLTRGGGHYIHAEKLRHTNAEAAAALARPRPLPRRRRQPAGQAGAPSCRGADCHHALLRTHIHGRHGVNPSWAW